MVKNRTHTDKIDAGSLPVTVIIAARNEEDNLPVCLESLAPAKRIIVVDSQSSDKTVDVARRNGAEVVQFKYSGGYPRKRQWAMDTLDIASEWIMLIDADETVPLSLWSEISERIDSGADAFLVKKLFHFLGRSLVFGGFSHSAVILFRKGTARFEELAQELDDGFDMEVHERLHVGGTVSKMKEPLLHNDAKSLDRYVERHRGYAKWEARVRYNFVKTGSWGHGMKGSLFGDVQQRRRFLKSIALRVPFEPFCWFVYHYILRLGFLEGKAGYTASRIRSQYIAWVRERLKDLIQHSS